MQPKRIEPLDPIEQLVRGQHDLGRAFSDYSVIPHPTRKELTGIRLAIAGDSPKVWEHAPLMEQTYRARTGVEVTASDKEMTLWTKLSEPEIHEIMKRLMNKLKEDQAVKPESNNQEQDKIRIRVELRKNEEKNEIIRQLKLRTQH